MSPPPPSTPSPPTLHTASFIKTVLPLYSLGLVRFANVSAADYQAHVSEYGVHWNFFLTMAVVTTVMRLLPIRQHHALPVAVALALLHQAALLLGARDYILHAPRTNGFFSANRPINSSPKWKTLPFHARPVRLRHGVSPSCPT